ncbi:MAG: gliding motility-associated C-terminal domain-containing protein [Burkholderiales bacterium]|nr:gliding motility-associated C-terminal domain-containing protein [Flavobacterium sp.]
MNVQDITAPVIAALPAASTIECPATPTFDQALATDDCGSVVTLTFADVNTPGANSSYSIVRTWTAVDACGNASTASQTINVQDSQAPVVPTLANVTGQCSATASPPSAIDNCAGSIVGTTNDPLTYSIQGTFIITWNFNDGNGNNFSALQTVIVDDTTNPDVPTLADVSGQCSVTVPAPTTTDNCTTSVTATTTDATNYTVPGTYVITWTFNDGNGNSINVTQNAIVTPANAAIAVTGLAECNKDSALVTNINLDSLLPALTPTGGVWTEISTISSNGLNGSVFTPYLVPVGDYVFSYVVADGDCTRIVNATITVDDNCIVDPDGTCIPIIHNAFSPNNDGINEVFIIDNIDDTVCFPTNSVEIYNRWGVLVFETKMYDNASHVFIGRSEGRVTVDKGAELPTGTYFYILNYTNKDGSPDHKDGYLYLTR